MAPTAVSTCTSLSLVNRSLVLLGDRPISSFDEASTQATIASAFYQPAYEEFCGSTGWRWSMRSVVPSRHTIHAWTDGVSYVAGDRVYLAGLYLTVYTCIVSHTAATSTNKPGSGSGWTAKWGSSPVEHAGESDTYETPESESYDREYALPDDFLTLYRVVPQAAHEIATARDAIAPAGRRLVLWANVDIEEVHYCAKVDEALMPPHAQEVFVLKMAHVLAIPVMANRARSEYFFGLYMKALRRAQAIDARQRPNTNVVANGRLPSEWDEI